MGGEVRGPTRSSYGPVFSSGLRHKERAVRPAGCKGGRAGRHAPVWVPQALVLDEGPLAADGVEGPAAAGWPGAPATAATAVRTPSCGPMRASIRRRVRYTRRLGTAAMASNSAELAHGSAAGPSALRPPATIL
jgi:hypothetical protein